MEGNNNIQPCQELLSLRWNNHLLAVQNLLSQVKEHNYFSDVSIACDGQIYSVHKLVLSSCSDYFSNMLRSSNFQHPIIVLKDIASSDFESLLSYMYLGEVSIRQENLTSLLKASESLGIKGLTVLGENGSLHQEKNKTSSMEDSTNRDECELPSDVCNVDMSNADECMYSEDADPASSISTTCETKVETETCLAAKKSRFIAYAGDTFGSEILQASNFDQANGLKCVKNNISDECSSGSNADTALDEVSLSSADVNQFYAEGTLHSVPQVCVNIKEEPESHLSDKQSSLTTKSVCSYEEDEGQVPHQPSTLAIAEVLTKALTSGKDNNSTSYLSSLECEELPRDSSPPLTGADAEAEVCLLELEPSRPQFSANISDYTSVHMNSEQVNEAGGSSKLKTTEKHLTSFVPIASKAELERSAVVEAGVLQTCDSGVFHVPGVTYNIIAAGVKCQPQAALLCHYCHFCQKGFAFASDLRRHLRSHTGERPYICDECGFKSAQKYNLERHKNIHKIKAAPKKVKKSNASKVK